MMSHEERDAMNSIVELCCMQLRRLGDHALANEVRIVWSALRKPAAQRTACDRFVIREEARAHGRREAMEQAKGRKR